jgi:hypothetical protein
MIPCVNIIFVGIFIHVYNNPLHFSKRSFRSCAIVLFRSCCFIWFCPFSLLDVLHTVYTEIIAHTRRKRQPSCVATTFIFVVNKDLVANDI